MKRLRHPSLAIFLAASLLLLGGAFSAQAAGHTVHHAHHNATTHSSPFCTWLCASGQVLQAVELGVDGPSFSLFVFDPWHPDAIVSFHTRSPLSRGPPSFQHLQ